MKSSNEVEDGIFINWVSDRYNAYLKGKEKGFNQKFGCPKCSKGNLVFEDERDIYYCTSNNCLNGSLKSLISH